MALARVDEDPPLPRPDEVSVRPGEMRVNGPQRLPAVSEVGGEARHRPPEHRAEADETTHDAGRRIAG